MIKIETTKKIISFACVLITLFLNSTAAAPDAELLKREEMVVISRQLGVTCNYCHDVRNFKKADLPNYKIALEHIRVTKLINDEGFKGKPKMDCYSCHRGKAKPDYQEKLSSQDVGGQKVQGK